MISDPVAGVHIMLDDEQKVAHQSALRVHGGNSANAQSAPAFEGNPEADAERRSRRLAED